MAYEQSEYINGYREVHVAKSEHYFKAYWTEGHKEGAPVCKSRICG
jgi:hypothetical protein